MEKIRILLADNNVELCQLLAEYLADQEGLEIAGVAYDGVQALEMIELLDPDVVLLDITMPQLDGIAVMERLPALNLARLPHVIVVTAFGREDILQRFTEMGADYFVVKPFDLELLARRIQEFGRLPRRANPNQGEAVHEAASSALPAASPTVTRALPETVGARFDGQAGRATVEVGTAGTAGSARSAANRRANGSGELSPEARLTLLLHQIGIPPHFKGYACLRDAVLMVLEDQSLIGGGLTKELYPKLGEKHHASAGAVEAAIRNAIVAAWDRGNREFLQELISPSATAHGNQFPTNSLVIAKLAERIRLGDAWPTQSNSESARRQAKA
ncbi:MAG: response regulator [Limnochordales bacterium]|nr:response regulator [Limnochordales bacterium]